MLAWLEPPGDLARSPTGLCTSGRSEKSGTFEFFIYVPGVVFRKSICDRGVILLFLTKISLSPKSLLVAVSPRLMRRRVVDLLLLLCALPVPAPAFVLRDALKLALLLSTFFLSSPMSSDIILLGWCWLLAGVEVVWMGEVRS